MTPTVTDLQPNPVTTTGRSPPPKRGPNKTRFADDDAAAQDMMTVVLSIFLFASLIGLIAGQLTSAGQNLTAFPGGTTILYLIPLFLVWALIQNIRGKSSGRGRGRGMF